MSEYFKKNILCILASTLLCSCNQIGMTKQHASNMTDEEKQAILEENFKVSPLQEKITDYPIFEIKPGIARKITFIKDEIIDFPLDSVTFMEDGQMEWKFYNLRVSNMIRAGNGHLSIIELVDRHDITSYRIRYYSRGVPFLLDSMYIENIKMKELDVYRFRYDYYGGISSIIHSKAFYDETTERYIFGDWDTQKYLIKETQEDIHGNWISRTFVDEAGIEYVQNRIIEYYRFPALIPTDREDIIYSVWDKNILLQYNIDTKTWQRIEPYNKLFEEEDSIPYWSMEDYRLIGNHLYCKFFTGQCGSGLQAIAFEFLDLQEGKWHFLTFGTEGSEFVGDCIMADVAWIVKEGESAFDTEYADSIKWIQME